MSRPLHSKSEALCGLIRADIAAGTFVPGSRLPSEAELGRLHGVSRTTVRAALATLAGEGVISSSQGARPVVLTPARGAEPAGPAAALVAVLTRMRLNNGVIQRLLQAIAAQLPPGSALRTYYTDVPAAERIAIGPRDLVLIDSGFVRMGFPALAPPERTVVFNQQGSVGGFIASDNRAGGRMIGEHLVAHGHRMVGMLHFGSQEQDFARRLAACRDALRKGGAELEEVTLNLHSHTEFTVKQGLELLFRRRAGISAVICMTDRMAIEVYEILAEFGRRVPQDISVVGFDGIDTSAWVEPPLTTVRHAYEDMARLLARALAGQGPLPRSLVRPVFIPGASVAQLGQGKPAVGRVSGKKQVQPR
jgi:DNA-binding transcriptional regulator YhcF (GntR family)